MSSSQVATQLQTSSASTRRLIDAILASPPAGDRSVNARPSTSDGAAAKTLTPTRPKFRRRVLSATSPVSCGYEPQPLTPDSHHVKSSPTVITAPTQVLSPARSFTSTSAASPVPRSHPSSELRSPSSKRQPASRSCHGIETSRGPPPALSTQRAYSSDNPWKLSTNKENFPAVQPKLTPHALAQLDAANNVQTKLEEHPTNEEISKSLEEQDIVHSIESAEDAKSEGMVATLVQSQPELAMDRERKRFSMEVDKRMSQRLSAQLQNGHTDLREDRSSEQSSQEDLFLNMAQAEGEDDQTIHADQDQPKSRIALPSTRLPLSRGQSAEQTPTTRDRRSSLQRPERVTDFRTPPSLDRSSTRDRSYAASAHPLEGRYTSRVSSGLQKPLPSIGRGAEDKDNLDSPSMTIKRFSDLQSYKPRGYRSSHLQNGTDGNYLSSPITTIRRGSIEQDANQGGHKAEAGTESSVSTTAPSTVWDELDDLKSRIRKLELTGRIPASSNAAVSTAIERPRTATTTVTTMSSSPKRTFGQNTSPTNQSFNDQSPHPVLNSALIRTKPHITDATYRALEATVADAQTLAKMTATSASGTGHGSSTFDRQLRRKADNLCRNLTDVCIALSHKPSEPSADRPQSRAQSRARSSSRDAATTLSPPPRQPSLDVDTLRNQRARSLDPEPTNTQRVLSRLEARRTSLMLRDSESANASAAASPTIREPSNNLSSNPEAKTPTQATLARTSTVLQRIRRHTPADDNEDDNDRTITFRGGLDGALRPLSRAATELGRANTTGHSSLGLTGAITPLASKRMSREYTSNHPLPSPESRALAVRSLGANRNRNGVERGSGSQRRSYLSSHRASGTSGAESVVGNSNGIGNGNGAENESREDSRLELRMPRTPGFAMGSGPQRRFLSQVGGSGGSEVESVKDRDRERGSFLESRRRLVSGSAAGTYARSGLGRKGGEGEGEGEGD